MVILAENEIIIYHLSLNHVYYTRIELYDFPAVESVIQCGMVLVIDLKNSYYKHEGEFGEKKHLMLTGHRDGSICIWDLEKLVF